MITTFLRFTRSILFLRLPALAVVLFVDSIVITQLYFSDLAFAGVSSGQFLSQVHL
jgi:hypothetical protein